MSSCNTKGSENQRAKLPHEEKTWVSGSHFPEISFKILYKIRLILLKKKNNVVISQHERILFMANFLNM